jgi:predicted metal-dependent phosphoesterase TrpH
VDPPSAEDRSVSGPVAFVDLHCHTSGSFDSLTDPRAAVRAAASRGLTHLAITDHERIDAALRARDDAREAGPHEITVIVGEEVRTLDGDLVCLFLEEAIPRGLPAVETIARVRAQGGLVGVPHPFDRFRGSLFRDAVLEGIAEQVDWVEGHNGRIIGSGNDRAREFAREHGLPAVAVSDAHSLVEIGVAYTRLVGDPSTPAGLLAALGSATLVTGRASYYVRAVTPVAKLVQRLRGQGRRPAATGAGAEAPR